MMILYRARTGSPYDNVNVNVPMNGSNLKYGFQWLNKRNSVDVLIVDEKTNASVLEHLVFKYDLLVSVSQSCTDLTDYNQCDFAFAALLTFCCDIGVTYEY